MYTCICVYICTYIYISEQCVAAHCQCACFPMYVLFQVRGCHLGAQVTPERKPNPECRGRSHIYIHIYMYISERCVAAHNQCACFPTYVLLQVRGGHLGAQGTPQRKPN